MTPSIAVVLPNHNDAHHLSRAVRSVLDQSAGADELIIIDDKSTDDSVPLIRSLIAGRANACLIENPVNLGVYGAVDVGLDRSRSDWVLFLAANDFVLPGIFERARASIARTPQVGLWSALSWMVDEEGRPVRLHPSPIVALRDRYLGPERCVRLAMRLGNWFTGPTLMYRREALEEAGRFDPAYMGMSDLHTALVIASRHGAAYSPAAYGVIRDHAGSYSGKTLADPAALDRMLEGMANHGRRAAPSLFTPAFVERTARRVHWTSVRRTGSATLEAFARRSPLLRMVARLPGGRLRLAASFAVMRPFDILPTLWYRVLGWLCVRLRVRWGASRESAAG
jgi:cellulose synthase/poly-beta-1,6-N-acetylglucosamine synthase-like glycosyltransferase